MPLAGQTCVVYQEFKNGGVIPSWPNGSLKETAKSWK